MLLRRRSGKTAALVIAFGFGGGILLLGVLSSVGSGAPLAAITGALIGYGLGALPFFLLAIPVGVSKSELWLLPETRTFRLLTYRPWRIGPRIEEAPFSEYAGVRTDPLDEQDGGGILVSLVTAEGESVPLRQFRPSEDVGTFAEQLASAAGLWLRRTDLSQDQPPPPPQDEPQRKES